MNVTDTADPVVGYDALVACCAGPLRELGVPAADAELVADSLVRAEAEGAASHGVARLPALLRRLRGGVAVPTAQLAMVRDSATMAVFDGGHGLGQVLAAQAMRVALDKARTIGLGSVVVRNSSHFGRAGHWAAMGVDDDLVGIAASNASPRVAQGPGARPVLGNNPWSVAVPAKPRPIVVDMANSVVAAGKIGAAAAAGRDIPGDWALDSDGEPTTDPERALAGALLAFGGHKGWALSLLVDVLTGVLAGGATACDVAPGTSVDRRHRSAQLFAALDVAAFLDPAEFHVGMAELRRRLTAAAGPDGRLPGELSARNLADARRDGVRLRRRTLTSVETAVTDLDLPWHPPT